MARIILWNSIAKRRRSISDTFYDNGLATLKGYLEEKGHVVEVIDWARDDYFQSFSPLWLTNFLRWLYPIIFSSKNKFLRGVLGLLSMQLQELLSIIQKSRFKRRIQRFIKVLKKDQTCIVGVKLWYGEAFSNAKYFIQELKKSYPSALTIAGGYHCTLYEEHLLATTDFDLGALGEGEYPLEKILEIADAHKGAWDKQAVLKDIVHAAENGLIENLLYRKEDKEVCKTTRHVSTAHSIKSIPRYTIDENKVRIHVMVESLGCDWGKCHFCVHAHFFPHYSLRNPEEIVREIQAMLGMGIGVFRFAGSDTPPAFGARIAQKILDNKLEIVFGMGSRAIRDAQHRYESLVTSYTTLIQAGLRAMFMGGETGNDWINNEVMNKGVTFDDIVYTVKALREAEQKVGKKVFLSLALIFPTPVLGKVDLKVVEEDNMRLLRAVMPDSVMITPPGPFLHTRWYTQRDVFGFDVSEDIIRQAMEYEYVLYKPPHLWPQLGISLEGRPFRELLRQCGAFRHRVEHELAIPTDISDEHFLMFYSAGITAKDDIVRVKNETMFDIVSCNYRVSRDLSGKVNAFSRHLAEQNLNKHSTAHGV